MATLTIGLIGAWIAISAYIGWLGFQQNRIARRLDALANLESRPAAPGESPSPAGSRGQQASRAA